MTDLTRRERRKAEVRNRLFKAALHLFKTQGYESTTVQEICDLADTAKATFFNYFPTKEHVLASYHDMMTTEILDSISKLKAEKIEWLILGAMQLFANWANADPAMGRILLRTMFGSDILIGADQANERKLYGWFRKQVRHGIRKGEFLSDLDVEVFCALLLGTLSTTVQSWILAEKKSNLDAALVERIMFLFRAAKSEQGDKWKGKYVAKGKHAASFD